MGASTLTLTGSGTSCATPLTARPVCNSASFLPNGGTVRYTGTGTTAVTGANYGQLDLHPTAGAPTYELGVSGASTFDIGTLNIGNGTNAVTATTSAESPTISVSGSVAVRSSATLSGSGTGAITVGGSLTGGGAVNLTAGTVELRGTGDADLTATGAGAAWQFATLAVSTTGAARAITVSSASRGINASTLLQVGRAADGTTTTLTTSAMTQPMLITGSIDITTRGSYALAPATTLHGNLTNSGTITPGTGTLTIAGNGVTQLASTGAGTLYNVSITTPGKVAEIATAGGQITNTLTLTGTCAAPVILRSSIPGMQRTFVNTGMTANVTYGSFQDIAATSPLTTTSAVDMGNNANISFGAVGTCTAPDGMRVDGQDAAGGTATTVAGGSAFPISVVDQMAGTADRQRTRVMSTPTDNVTGLWHMDTLTNPIADEWHAVNSIAGSPNLFINQEFFAPDFGSAPGPAGHGTTLEFGGSSILQTLAGAPTAAFDAPSFTIEAWFRTDSLDNGESSPAPVIVERGNWWQNQKFTLNFESTTNQLNAAIGAGGTGWTMSIGAAPYLDNAWHHVALTVIADAALPGPGEMRLYLDGNERAMRTFTGAQNTYSGITNNKLVIGEAQGGPDTKFVGELDEIRFSSVARTEAEIRGYIATSRPHATTVWQTAAGTGDALAPTCATVTRCANVAYGGPALPDEGRWYAQQQLRTPGGTWTAWSAPAWFETRSAITVGVSGPMAFGSVLSGSNTPASTTATVNCGAATGCKLFASAYSDTVALDDGGLNSIPRHAPAAPTAPALWPLGTADGLGISVASTTSGKDTSRWGTGALPTDTTTLFYQGMTRTPSLLATSNAPGTESVVIAGRLNVPPSTAIGTYSGLLSLVAVPNI